jgi:hypothetical protein
LTSRPPKTAGCHRVERPHRASPNSKGFHTVYTTAQGFPGSTPKSLAARGSEVPHRHQGGGLGFFTHMGGPTLRNRVPHSIHGGPRVPRPEGGPGSQDFAACEPKVAMNLHDGATNSMPIISGIEFRNSNCFLEHVRLPVEGKFEIGPFKCKQKMLDSTGKAPTSPKRLQPGDVVITDTSLTPFVFNQPVTPVPAGTEGTVVGVSPGTGAVEIQFQDVPFRQKVFDFLLYGLPVVLHERERDSERERKRERERERDMASVSCSPSSPVYLLIMIWSSSSGQRAGPMTKLFA